MAVFVFDNAKLLVGDLDASGVMNRIELSGEADVLDGTTFNGALTRTRISGLLSAGLEGTGFVDLADGDDSPDARLFAAMGVNTSQVLVSPDGLAVDQIVFFMPVVEAAYSPGASVGELLGFTVRAQSRGELVRGQILVSPDAMIAATGQSAAKQLGAVAAGKRMYAAVHLLEVDTFTSLDVKVQSDNAVGFPSATDRITFAQFTAIGAQLSSVLAGAGGITDDWWRIDYTLVGTGARFCVALGIK